MKAQIFLAQSAPTAILLAPAVPKNTEVGEKSRSITVAHRDNFSYNLRQSLSKLLKKAPPENISHKSSIPGSKTKKVADNTRKNQLISRSLPRLFEEVLAKEAKNIEAYNHHLPFKNQLAQNIAHTTVSFDAELQSEIPIHYEAFSQLSADQQAVMLQLRQKTEQLAQQRLVKLKAELAVAEMRIRHNTATPRINCAFTEGLKLTQSRLQSLVQLRNNSASRAQLLWKHVAIWRQPKVVEANMAVVTATQRRLKALENALIRLDKNYDQRSEYQLCQRALLAVELVKLREQLIPKYLLGIQTLEFTEIQNLLQNLGLPTQAALE